MNKVGCIIDQSHAVAPRDGKAAQQLQLLDNGAAKRLIIGKKGQMFQTLSRPRSRRALSTLFMPMLEGQACPERAAIGNMGIKVSAIKF